jgi:hypothetical protein
MRMTVLLFLMTLVSQKSVFSCEKHREVFYPLPANNVDREIDDLLDRAEEDLIMSDFKPSLARLERAELLLPLTQDSDDLRKLRILFDKAWVVTCLEGDTENSKCQFHTFELLLDTKSCIGKHKEETLLVKRHKDKDQDAEEAQKQDIQEERLEDPNRLNNWCEETVNGTAKAMDTLLSFSPSISKAALRAIVAGLKTRALKCCATGEFWKACVTPIYEKWQQWNQRWEMFRMPPDPYWD